MSKSEGNNWFRACFTCCALHSKERPTLFLCSQCRKVSYCSKECQKAHWKLRHKVECKDVYCNKSTTIEELSNDELVITYIQLVDEKSNVGKGAYIKQYSPEHARVYEGEFWAQSPQHTPHRHGQGRYLWGDGSFYEGTWNKDYRCGFGEHLMSNGNIYKGKWENDCMEGDGVMEFFTGFKYTGKWQQDCMHGQGQMINPLGEIVYEGEYEYDEPKGGYDMLVDKRNPYQVDSEMAQAIAARNMN